MRNTIPDFTFGMMVKRLFVIEFSHRCLSFWCKNSFLVLKKNHFLPIIQILWYCCRYIKLKIQIERLPLLKKNANNTKKTVAMTYNKKPYNGIIQLLNHIIFLINSKILSFLKWWLEWFYRLNKNEILLPPQ